MIMYRDRKRFLRDLLPNHVLVERAPDFGRLWYADIRRLTLRILIELLIEDAFANVNATVAYINARPGDQLAHLGMALATKRAHCEVGSAGHVCF